MCVSGNWICNFLGIYSVIGEGSTIPTRNESALLQFDISLWEIERWVFFVVYPPTRCLQSLPLTSLIEAKTYKTGKPSRNPPPIFLWKHCILVWKCLKGSKKILLFLGGRKRRKGEKTQSWNTRSNFWKNRMENLIMRDKS